MFKDNIFKTKEVMYIDDCRHFNYLECLGLIHNGLNFDLFIAKNYSNALNKMKFFKSMINKYLESYSLSCDPIEKSTTIIFKGKFDIAYTVKILPKDDLGIQIDVYEKEDVFPFCSLNYSVDEMLDFMI